MQAKVKDEETDENASKNKSQISSDGEWTVEQPSDDGPVTADWILRNSHRLARLNYVELGQRGEKKKTKPRLMWLQYLSAEIKAFKKD